MYLKSIALLIIFFIPVSVQSQDFTYNGDISLYFGSGVQLPVFGSTVTGRATETIPTVFDFTRLIDLIYIEASAKERFYLNLDYNSLRQDILGAGNTYNFLYKGKYHEAFKWISVGNLHHTIEGIPLLPIFPGSSGGIAVKAIADFSDIHIEGLLRYDNIQKRSKTFIGQQEYINTTPSDTSFVKRKFFHLPDDSVDGVSILLYRSLSNGSLLFDGKSFEKLAADVDYTIDPELGWIYLKYNLSTDEELLIFYTKTGTPAGDGTLGINSYITPAGVRDNFNAVDYPEQFANKDGTNHLYLLKADTDSYWELKNGYRIPGVTEESIPQNISILLRNLQTGAVNDEYSDISRQTLIHSGYATIFFIPDDGFGFYPRPFPGLFPFDHPSTPDNPFEATNPVYSDSDSINLSGEYHYLDISYTIDVENYFLGFAVITDSVEVTVDGRKLSSSDFEIDDFGGELTIKQGRYSPTSIINITWHEGDSGTEAARLLAVLTADIPIDEANIKIALKADIPIIDQTSPKLSEIKDVDAGGGFSFNWLSGDKEDGSYLSVSADGAAYLYSPSLISYVRINGMEDQQNIEISLNADDWMIASKSTVTPFGISFGTRGDMYFKNYFYSGVFSGTQLNPIATSLSASQIFAYSEKSGPYNTSDISGSGDSISLVLDYLFTDTSTDPYTTVSIDIDNRDLSSSDRIEIILKHLNAAGNPGEIPYLYIEILQDYQEDINGNGILDTENYIENLGFVITPTEGNSTKIGTTPAGEANGKIDSEDRNGNGILDQPGGGIETGQVISESGGNEYIYALTSGSSTGWTTVSFDINHLKAAEKELWENASTIRLTIGGISGPFTADSSGKVMINSISFEKAPVTNDNPAAIETFLTTDGNGTSTEIAVLFPEEYKKLYGSESTRLDNAHQPQILRVNLNSTLTAGNEVSVSTEIYPRSDLTYFKTVSFFINKPSAPAFPDDAVFYIEFEDAVAGSIRQEIPCSALNTGWNLITMPFGENVIINGISTILPFTDTALHAVYKITTGLRADISDILADRFFFIDEIYLQGINPSAGYSVTANFQAQYDEPFAEIDYFPILSLFNTNIDFFHDGNFTANYNPSRKIGGAVQIGVTAASWFPVSLETALSKNWLESAFYEEHDYSFLQSFGFNGAENEYLPEISIIYHGYDKISTAPEKDENRHSISFNGSGSVKTFLSYTLNYSRLWNKSPGLTYSSIEENADILLNLSPEWAVFRLTGSTKLVYKSDFFTVKDPWSAWPDVYGSLFKADWRPENSIFSSKSDSILFNANIPVKKVIGFSNDISLQYQETYADLSSKNVSVYEMLKIGLPFSFFDKKLNFTISWERSIQSSFASRPMADKGYTFIGSTAKGFGFGLFPENGYISPPALMSNTLFNSETGLTNIYLKDYAAANFKFNKPSIYLPDAVQIWVQQDGGFNGYLHTAKRSIGTSVNRRYNKTIDAETLTSIYWKFTASAEQDLRLLNWNLSGNGTFSFQRRIPNVISTLDIGLLYSGIIHDPSIPIDPLLVSEITAAGIQDLPYEINKTDINGRLSFSIDWTQLPEGSEEESNTAENVNISESETESPKTDGTDNLLLGSFVKIEHTETLIIESLIYDGSSYFKTGTSRLPLIITLEHKSIFYQETFFSLEFMIRLAGGFEERFYNDQFNTFTSIGIELGITGNFSF